MVKQNISILFLLILFSQCSVPTDPRLIFLTEFQGTWKTSEPSVIWFKSLTPTVSIIAGTVVNVDKNGTFTIAGITFTFVEIESNAIVAVYSFIHNGLTFYVGIGFGEKDDVLITSPVVAADLVQSTTKGDIFLIK